MEITAKGVGINIKNWNFNRGKYPLTEEEGKTIVPVLIESNRAAETNMISRERAVWLLHRLINANVFDVDTVNGLQEIANCIEHEEDMKIHAWGMPADEYHDLMISYPVNTPEYEKQCDKQRKIIKKYSFTQEES